MVLDKDALSPLILCRSCSDVVYLAVISIADVMFLAESFSELHSCLQGLASRMHGCRISGQLLLWSVRHRNQQTAVSWPDMEALAAVTHHMQEGISFRNLLLRSHMFDICSLK